MRQVFGVDPDYDDPHATSATNKIAASVLAYIDGDGATGITADGDIALSASDTSTIVANAVGASLAAALAPAAAASVTTSDNCPVRVSSKPSTLAISAA